MFETIVGRGIWCLAPFVGHISGARNQFEVGRIGLRLVQDVGEFVINRFEIVGVDGLGTG